MAGYFAGHDIGWQWRGDAHEGAHIEGPSFHLAAVFSCRIRIEGGPVPRGDSSSKTLHTIGQRSEYLCHTDGPSDLKSSNLLLNRLRLRGPPQYDPAMTQSYGIWEEDEEVVKQDLR